MGKQAEKGGAEDLTSAGLPVPLTEIKQGDIVCYKGHELKVESIHLVKSIIYDKWMVMLGVVDKGGKYHAMFADQLGIYVKDDSGR